MNLWNAWYDLAGLAADQDRFELDVPAGVNRRFSATTFQTSVVEHADVANYFGQTHADLVADETHNGAPDCADNCIDWDRDGYGTSLPDYDYGD